MTNNRAQIPKQRDADQNQRADLEIQSIAKDRLLHFPSKAGERPCERRAFETTQVLTKGGQQKWLTQSEKYRFVMISMTRPEQSLRGKREKKSLCPGTLHRSMRNLS